MEESGLCEGPILITNTHSVGVARDAAIQWMRGQNWPFEWTIPVVGETYDGVLNDIDGHHVRPEHVFAALNSALGGPVAEGNVGGGTGMITYWYKGGTGTASRRLEEEQGGYTVGALVQSNYGTRQQLRIAGIPVGARLSHDLPRFLEPALLSPDLQARYKKWCAPGDGSIIVVVATDAPLLPHQLKRLAKRPALAIGRLGGVGATSSGDIFVAVSTANAGIHANSAAARQVEMLPNSELTPLFEATIDATEEAILNALVAGTPVEGANRLYVPSLPHSEVQDILREHRLLIEQ